MGCRSLFGKHCWHSKNVGWKATFHGDGCNTYNRTYWNECCWCHKRKSYFVGYTEYDQQEYDSHYSNRTK